jgi:hypothetical protein
VSTDHNSARLTLRCIWTFADRALLERLGFSAWQTRSTPNLFLGPISCAFAAAMLSRFAINLLANSACVPAILVIHNAEFPTIVDDHEIAMRFMPLGFKELQ